MLSDECYSPHEAVCSAIGCYESHYLYGVLYCLRRLRPKGHGDPSASRRVNRAPSAVAIH